MFTNDVSERGWSVCVPACPGWLAGEAVVEDAGEAGVEWRIWKNNRGISHSLFHMDWHSTM